MGCALAIGSPGSLVLGVEMCCTIVWTEFFVLGIFIGIIGIVICGAAYPIYKNTIDKKLDQVAPQILNLSNEIKKGF